MASGPTGGRAAAVDPCRQAKPLERRGEQGEEGDEQPELDQQDHRGRERQRDVQEGVQVTVGLVVMVVARERVVVRAVMGPRACRFFRTGVGVGMVRFVREAQQPRAEPEDTGSQYQWQDASHATGNMGTSHGLVNFDATLTIPAFPYSSCTSRPGMKKTWRGSTGLSRHV